MAIQDGSSVGGSMQVDSKVPRAKAWFHALLPAAAFLMGPPAAVLLLAFCGLAMAASVLGGPRFSLFGLLFKKAIRPLLKIGPGHPEDVRPHRFAEALGAAFLLAASASYAAGAIAAGQILALIVVALALLNALSGICIGCQMYLLIRRRLFSVKQPRSEGVS